MKRSKRNLVASAEVVAEPIERVEGKKRTKQEAGSLI